MEPLATQENINQPKSKISREVFLIIILAVLLILVNGYFFYKQYSAPSQVTTQELVRETENMSEWKTYRNEEYGFEFKYPPTMKIGEEINFVYLKENDFNNPTLEFIGFSIHISPTNFKDSNEWIKDEFKNRKELYPIIKPSFFNEIPANFIKDPITEGGCASDYLAFVGNNYLYKISCVDTGIILYENILSTFKFTSIDTLGTEKANITDWKIYRNEKYGFEFKYPSYYKPVIIYKDLALNELFRVDFVAESLTAESFSPPISLAIWNNNKKLSLIDWANSNRDFSNYGDGYFNVNFNKKIISQNNAISYEWEVGEYGKTILIENKTNIFVISTSNTGQIDILKDLDNISETIKFFSVDGSVLLKQCPEEWIDNQMPGIRDVNDSSQTNRQYFILNGERREMTEFDIDWVNKNCKLEKQTVY